MMIHGKLLFTPLHSIVRKLFCRFVCDADANDVCLFEFEKFVVSTPGFECIVMLLEACQRSNWTKWLTECNVDATITQHHSSQFDSTQRGWCDAQPNFTHNSPALTQQRTWYNYSRSSTTDYMRQARAHRLNHPSIEWTEDIHICYCYMVNYCVLSYVGQTEHFQHIASLTVNRKYSTSKSQTETGCSQGQGFQTFFFSQQQQKPHSDPTAKRKKKYVKTPHVEWLKEMCIQRSCSAGSLYDSSEPKQTEIFHSKHRSIVSPSTLWSVRVCVPSVWVKTELEKRMNHPLLHRLFVSQFQFRLRPFCEWIPFLFLVCLSHWIQNWSSMFSERASTHYW